MATAVQDCNMLEYEITRLIYILFVAMITKSHSFIKLLQCHDSNSFKSMLQDYFPCYPANVENVAEVEN